MKTDSSEVCYLVVKVDANKKQKVEYILQTEDSTAASRKAHRASIKAAKSWTPVGELIQEGKQTFVFLEGLVMACRNDIAKDLKLV